MTLLPLSVTIISTCLVCYAVSILSKHVQAYSLYVDDLFEANLKLYEKLYQVLALKSKLVVYRSKSFLNPSI